MFRRRIKKPLPHGIGPHGVHEVTIGQSAVDARPCRPEIGRLPDIGLAVAHLLALGGHVGGALFMGRGVDQADPRVYRKARGRHVRPVATAVFRYVHESVVRTGPHGPVVEIRRRDRVERRIDFRSVLIEHDLAARRPERVGIRAREIGTDLRPVETLVRAAPQVLGAGVEGVGLLRRKDDGERPVPAFVHGRRRLAHDDIRVRKDVAHAFGLPIETRQTIRLSREENALFFRMHRDIAHLAAGHGVIVRIPVLRRKPEVRTGAAGDAYGRIVLLRAAHMVREVVGCRDAIDLRRPIVLLAPVPAAIDRNAAAAVIGDDHAIRVRRIDPEIVNIHVTGAHGRKRLAAVRGLFKLEAQDKDLVPVLRVRPHLHEVERALPKLAVTVNMLPGLAAVV